MFLEVIGFIFFGQWNQDYNRLMKKILKFPEMLDYHPPHMGWLVWFGDSIRPGFMGKFTKKGVSYMKNHTTCIWILYPHYSVSLKYLTEWFLVLNSFFEKPKISPCSSLAKKSMTMTLSWYIIWSASSYLWS